MFELHITNHLSILNGKMSKFKTPKNEKKNIQEMCIELVHIFNVLTIIRQNLHIKE